MLRKILSAFLIVGILPVAARADIKHDMADPMFLEAQGDFVSRSSISYGHDILRIAQKFSYGFSNRFSLGADIKYQEDFNGREDGFSNINLGGTFRLSGATDGNSRIISDALFGINFGGTKRVREPEFADTVYYAGIRVGRQWNRFTLAGTVKTSWIFDDERGMAYIDIIPEAYFRITDKWMAGAGFEFRKSTRPAYDTEWVNFKLVRQYGRTQYVGHLDYEFEEDNWQFGVKVNILF